ncbi:MAG TPA: glycosyl hydrolase [Chitinophagaceae bacterium]|nr:glycosyl hydrolase [Chitinophagaceae bacterium]
MKKLMIGLISLYSLGAQAQTKITSAQFSIMEARALGPGTMSGRITAIEGVAKDNGKTIYVGTAGGGIWKSTNAGVSYKPIFDKYCQSIGALAIDPNNEKVIYAGTGESNMRNSVSIGVGIYKSTDAGDNWKKIGMDSTEHISRIIVHPKNSEVVFAAVPGPLWNDSEHRGLYKSTDGGNTWNKILYKDNKTGCAEILMDPSNPDIMYASMWQFRRLPYSFNSGGPGSGLFKSTDGGKTWRELSKGLPAKPFGRIAMNLAPSNPKKMLAIVENKETGLYISEDGGETWKSQSATMNIVARPFYFSTIAFDPKDEKRVYRPAFEFAYSDDGGYSFTNASYEGGWVHSDMHAIWINPNNPNLMYIGTDGGVYTSIDRGVTWVFNHALPVGQFYHVSHDLQDPYNVYGGLQDNGSWKGPSSAPGGVSNASWSRVGGGDGFWTIPDIDGRTVYCEWQGGKMQRVNMQTMKAEGIQPERTSKEDKLRWNWNTPLLTGAKNPRNLYTGAQYLYKSTDQGRNWKRISPDLTTNDKKKQDQENSGGLSADNTSAENHCTIFTIAESPLDENIIWVGTDDGNLQYTNNGGGSWINVSQAITKSGIANQAWVSSIEPSHFNKETVYATFENHMYGDHKTYLAKSTDMGKTWTRIMSDDFTGFAHKIKEDGVNPNLLFLGTEMGLFSSLDGGNSWFRMKNNIPEYALVRDIQIHPKTHDLIIGTHGRGIYILDDIRAIRDLNKEIVEKEVHIFQTPDIVLNYGRFGWGGPETSGGWYAGNSRTIPTIDYYLKDRVSSGKATLEIYDESGKLVQSIPATVRRGINKIDWNLRSTPPRVASGSTKMDAGGFNAPMVLPGNYTAKLKIKDKEYTTKIKCVHDENNKDLSVNDRKLVHEKSMQLQKLFNQVNDRIDSIAAIQKRLKADTVKFAKKKTMKQMYYD